MPRRPVEWPLRTWTSSVAVAALAATLASSPPVLSAEPLREGSEPPARTRPLELVRALSSRVFAAQGGQREIEIRRVTAELFDLREIARLTLGEHWQEGSVEEQDEFVRLFAGMLERAYLTNIRNMPPPTVTFEDELISEPYARVTSRVASQRGETSIEYRLWRNRGRWAVYDVAVNGVGLVSSYRSQFNSILRNGSFADLLARMRSRGASARQEQGP